jgi:hypothetical protein
MAMSMAPGLSQVLVYEAPYGLNSVNDDMLNQIAVDDLANQISCSWYIGIDSTTDFIFQEMAAQGQSFYIASGDFGAYYFDAFPAQSDPNITVVGGTTLTTSGPGGARTAETVWNWFTSGSGPDASSGGISSTYAIPYWQQAVNMSSNQGSSIWRNMPDVALTADNVLVVSASTSETVGGTSCAAPLWAGFTALINQQGAQNGLPPVGFLNPAIYVAAQSALYPSLFRDITTGNNTNYNGSTKYYAVPGYDLCTGWGTPNGQALINVLAPPDSLILLPRGGVSFAAANDYPLSIESQTLALKNPGTTNINWALGPVPSWLGVSVSHGSISPSQDSFITLAAIGAATNLPPGEYVTNLLLTNLTAGVTHLVPVFLDVFDPLLITPDSGMTVIGPPGGPFDETSETFYLTNFASVPMDWTAQSTSSFFDLSPASGTLQPGASIAVVATLDPSASNILISAQTGNFLFTDLNTTNTQSQPFTLTVGNGGFETGDFSDWTLDGDPYPDNFVAGGFTWDDYVHSGEYAALLGEAGKTASLSQTLPTVAGQLYQVSFFLNNPTGDTPNSFEVIWGGSNLFSQVSVPALEWTEKGFAVFATNAATTLEFVARNDDDVFGLDDISVTPIGSPTFSSAVVSNSSLYISWNAVPGAKYQLQFSTDLISWITSGEPTPATNSIMTVKKTIQRADPQQYYRLYLIAQ